MPTHTHAYGWCACQRVVGAHHVPVAAGAGRARLTMHHQALRHTRCKFPALQCLQATHQVDKQVAACSHTLTTERRCENRQGDCTTEPFKPDS